MGKKHKKHTKDDVLDNETAKSEDKPIKLVLKVGALTANASTDSFASKGIIECDVGKKHKHKKKKKKHKHESEKHKDKEGKEHKKDKKEKKKKKHKDRDRERGSGKKKDKQRDKVQDSSIERDRYQKVTHRASTERVISEHGEKVVDMNQPQDILKEKFKESLDGLISTPLASISKTNSRAGSKPGSRQASRTPSRSTTPARSLQTPLSTKEDGRLDCKKRSHEGTTGTSGTEEPPAKKLLFNETDLPASPDSQRLRERTVVDPSSSALIKCLDYLNRILERKDTHGFFSSPVTDSIAPGYSAVIKTPMDFSTISEKIRNGEYSCVHDWKRDVKLMCDNCTRYNREDTVFYKEAKRLQKAMYNLSAREKLLSMRRQLDFMKHVTDDMLGIDTQAASPSPAVDSASSPASLPIAALGTEESATPDPMLRGATLKRSITRQTMPQLSRAELAMRARERWETIKDDMSSAEIIAQAKAAAKDAAIELTLRQPNSKLGFLKRREDGSTTFNILNPDNDGSVNDKERIVDLGTLTGKLTSGTGQIAGFKEDKRNKATPVTYMNYGAFSSYAPVYDSAFSTISKEDSDLLLSTYGDETGLQYAMSLKSFVSDADDYCIRMVDNLLDILTFKQHSKTMKTIHDNREAEDKRVEEERVRRQRELDEKKKSHIDFDSLRTLEIDGIDMSFLDAFEQEIDPRNETRDQDITNRLAMTSTLLVDLQHEQRQRLSSKLPAHLSMVPRRTAKEKSIADKITKELTELARKALPSDIASTEGIRKALGITLSPVPDRDLPSIIIDGVSDRLPGGAEESQPVSDMDRQAAAMDQDLQNFFDEGPNSVDSNNALESMIETAIKAN